MKSIDFKSVLIGFLMAVIFFVTTGQKSKNMGKIIATEITLQDEYGNIKGSFLITEEGNGAFFLMDRYSNTNPYFSVLTGGEVRNPSMDIYNNKTNQKALMLGANQHGGYIYVADKKGEFVWGATGDRGAAGKQ